MCDHGALNIHNTPGSVTTDRAYLWVLNILAAFNSTASVRCDLVACVVILQV